MSSSNPYPEPDVLKVSVLGKDSIIFGFHLTDYMIRDILTNIPSLSYAIITDKNIAPLYLQIITSRFDVISDELFSNKSIPAKPRLLTYVIPPGEQSKSRIVKAQVEDYLLSQSCTRDTCILALGGGVIGDLAGYVAATFMRGVSFVQIPTSLLAMADSSVGGKTAIDTPHGKNLIGAFWQPKRVFIDLAYLDTLPKRQFANGMAEIIKTAAFWDEKFFVMLENGEQEIQNAATNKDRGVEYQGMI